MNERDYRELESHIYLKYINWMVIKVFLFLKNEGGVLEWFSF